MTNWFDSDGFLHLEPNPKVDSTINAPLYHGTYICLKFAVDELNADDISQFLYALSNIYWDDVWHTHSKSLKDRFAHDNFTGIVCALVCCKRWCEARGANPKEINNWLYRVPFFHPNADHPRDFIYYNFVKYPWLFFPLIWFTQLTMVVTCWQTYKIRNGRYIIKTDGKILALLRLIATPMPATGWACNWLIKNKLHKLESGWHFKWLNWWFVFNEYYKNKEHPNLHLIKKYIERFK